ncbi:MAG: S-layer protein, partial [Candidatus Aenigmarchaeota archaeon]|nr:S-layer protein [Candidatus Aenigmarchaeota archaeon]
MQFGKIGKILAAGSVAAVMMGATVSFAALDSYPSPFVSGSSFDSLVVVGAAAAPSDVVGAIDVATRLGGETTTLVSTTGAKGVLSVSGEGRTVASGTTQVFLADSLGKSGLRTTMTKDDLPTVLADGTLNDADASTTHKYTQYIKLTPSATGGEPYLLQFDRPGSSSSSDPDYNFGRFPTGPTNTDYFYSTQVIFDKAVWDATSIGEKLNIFGGTYTITTGTLNTTAELTTNKLVLSGGAETRLLKGGEQITVTLDGVNYDITYIASSSSTQGIVEVIKGGVADQGTITKGASKKINGLDVFLDDVFDVSSTDPTQDSGKLLLGSSKLTFKHGSKVLKGETEDSIDGTFVNLTTSASGLSTLTVRHGAHSSTEDFLKRGGEYTDNIWKTFKIVFPDITPSLTDAARNKLMVKNSGDNQIQLEFTDDRGNMKTLDWGYKASSSVQGFKLADNGGDNFIVVENATVSRDQYIILDAGDFTHMFEVSGVNLDGTSSASIDLKDVFSGSSLKISTGTDNIDGKVIDGQSYNFLNLSSTTFAVTWGAGIPTAGANTFGAGSYLTVWPVLKGRADEHIAFTQPTVINLNFSAQVGKIQLPTGAITVTRDRGTTFNITNANNEDGTSSVIGTVAGNSTTTSTSVTYFNASASGTEVSFALSRTSTGGAIYNFRTVGVDTHDVNLTVGAAAAGNFSQPAILLWEQKDDSNNAYSVFFPISTETSGSNQLGIAGQPKFTHNGANETALGSDSNVLRAVDLYGVYTERKTSGQDSVTAWVPKEEVQAHIGVVALGATASVGGGAGGTTVKQAVPVKTAVAKLDTEVTSADKTTKNFVLVGGPAVNTLVSELAAAGKTWDTAKYREEGAGTAIVQLIETAFTSGKSALVVAGHSAADTRTVTGVMQNFDAHASSFSGKSLVIWKNGVISSS